MALQPCRECGQPVSTEAASCPHCGAPIQPQAQGYSSATERPERELYHNRDVTVTTRRFMVGAKTYAIQSITSVVMSKKTTSRGGGQIGCGLFLAVAAIGTIAEQGDGYQWIGGLVLLAVAAYLVVDALREPKRPPPATFAVTLTSASGEQMAFSSTDELVVRDIVEHLNQAIANRD